MQMLHAATGPERGNFPELLLDSCCTATPAPFAAFSKFAPSEVIPWVPFGEQFVAATTHWQPDRIQSHIAGASLNPASKNLAIGWE